MRISDWSSDVCSSDLDGVRGAARIGEQRRQSDNFGFAEGAAAAGVSTREAARPDSFIQALSRTAGNQEIGRASCRETGCPYVSIYVVAESLQKNNQPTKIT